MIASSSSIINRTVVIVVPKKKFFDWSTTVFPGLPPLTPRFNDNNSYLLNQNCMIKDAQTTMENYWKYIFENELHSVIPNKEKWPAERSYELFTEFFECVFSARVFNIETEEMTYSEHTYYSY